MSVYHCFRFLAACFSLSLSTAAQSRLGPAYFLRHPTSEPRLGTMRLPAGPVPGPPTVAPMTTIATTLAGAPLPTFPRHDLTGSLAFLPYDQYQNLPEPFRKYTLPPAWAEFLPLQLLRSALGR